MSMLTFQQIQALIEKNYPRPSSPKPEAAETSIFFLARLLYAAVSFTGAVLGKFHVRITALENGLVAPAPGAATAPSVMGGAPAAAYANQAMSPGTASGAGIDPAADAAWVMAGIDQAPANGAPPPIPVPQTAPSPPPAPTAASQIVIPPSIPTAQGGNPLPPEVQAAFAAQAARNSGPSPNGGKAV